jgi:hypothetical protein
VLALFLGLGSAVGGFVAWLAALAATGRRTDKSWFVVLLVLGLLSIGFLATLMYLVAGSRDEPEAAGPSVDRVGQRPPTPIHPERQHVLVAVFAVVRCPTPFVVPIPM